MKEYKSLTEFKIYELLGDAVLRVIVLEILFKEKDIDKFDKAKLHNLAIKIMSNKFLTYVAKDMQLIPHPEDEKGIYPHEKPYANAFEAKLYNIYLNHGEKAATRFVSQNLFTRIKDYKIKA